MLVVSPAVAAEFLARLVTASPSKKLHAVAEAAARHEGRVKGIIVRAVRNAQAIVPMAELEQVLSLGHSGTGAPLYVLEDVIRAYGDALLGKEHATTHEHQTHVRTLEGKGKTFPETLIDVLHGGAKAAPLPKAKPLAMKFDVANQEAVDWAEAEAAKLVTAVTSDARAAIRVVVSEGLDGGVSPKNTAKLIRSSIGLTERDAGAVMNKHLSMLADGVDGETAAKRSERYATKLLNSRAETIARTETIRAANEGQSQLWEQAAEAGLLDKDTAMKTWIASPDACPECEEVADEVVPMSEDFSVGQDPPLHPNCRCTIGLVG